MSVTRPLRKNGTRSPYYRYDFKIRLPGRVISQRFSGPTGQKTKAAAKRIEDRVRALACEDKLSELLTLGQATKRYLEEVTSPKPSAHARRQDELCMSELERFFGADILLVAITPDDVSRAAVKRAKTPIARFKRLGQFVRKNGRQKAATYDEIGWQSTGKLPQPATVNRQLRADAASITSG